MNKSLRLLSAFILGAVMFLGACGDESTNGTTTEDDPAAEETQEGPAVTTVGALAITAFDFGFREEAPTVAAGEVALSFRNTGKAPHTFTVEGLEVDLSAGGGETVESVFSAEAGTYKFVCTIHPQMTGELVVE